MLFRPNSWVPASFPSLLVPCIFFFISLHITFISSFILQLNSISSVSILITSVLNSASDRLATSSLLSCIFSGALTCSFIWAIFFVPGCLLSSKGWSLRCSPVWGNPRHCVVALCVGEGSEREQWRLLCSLPDFSHFPWYPQANWALLVLIPKWVGLCTFQDSVGLCNELSSEAGSFSCCRLNHHWCF